MRRWTVSRAVLVEVAGARGREVGGSRPVRDLLITVLFVLGAGCGGVDPGDSDGDTAGMDGGAVDAAFVDASRDARVPTGPCRPEASGEFPAALECDDGDPCTWDVCIGGPDGGCANTRHDSLCQGYTALSAATYGGCAIAVDRSVWCWHLSSSFDGPSHVPTRIEGVDGALKVRVGAGAIDYSETETFDGCRYETRGSHALQACALVEGGQLLCWALDIGATPSAVASAAPITDFEFIDGGSGVCGITSDSAFECWSVSTSGGWSGESAFLLPVRELLPSHLMSRDCVAGVELCARLSDGSVECRGARGSAFSPHAALPAAIDDLVFTGVGANILGGFVASRGSCWLSTGQVSCTPLVSSCGAEPVIDGAENLVPIGNGFCAQTAEGVRCGVWALPNHSEVVSDCRTNLYSDAGWRVSEPAPDTAGAELMDGVWDFPCIRRAGTFECWNPRVGSEVRFPPWEAPFHEPELVDCGWGEPCLCPSSQTLCGSSAGDCVDTSSDPEHCGSCDRVCPPSAACAGGACRCPGEMGIDCGGACVDAARDEAHCGSCGSACPVDEACADGRCLPVQEVRLAAAALYDLYRADDLWTDARNWMFGTLRTSMVYEVNARHSPYWGEYVVHRVALRFIPPALPSSAVIVGGALRVRPSEIENVAGLNPLQVVSFEPELSTGITGRDYNIVRWGASAMGSIPTSSLAVESFSQATLHESVAAALAPSGHWYLGLRAGPDLSGGTPASGPSTAGGPFPHVWFDSPDDVELIVHYVVPGGTPDSPSCGRSYPCDPVLDAGCPISQGCYLTGPTTASCAPPGAGLSSAPCTLHTDCAPRQICAGAPSACRPLCCGPGDDARCEDASLGGMPGDSCTEEVIYMGGEATPLFYCTRP